MSQFIVVDGINTTLADAVTTTDTSITLASSANLPTLLAGQILPLIVQSASNASAYEIMYGTAISGAEITVTRGMEGTTAQAFNVGDYVLCGPTAGTNALIRAVMNPATSMTLPQAYGAAVIPSGLSAAITLTLPNAAPAGTSYVIYGNSSYAVTVAVSVDSGSPFIGLPDGTTVYSWTIPASTGQGLRIVFDGTNWRAQTFGQTVVAPAAQSNAAVQLEQMTNGSLSPTFNNLAASGTTTLGTTTVPSATAASNPVPLGQAGSLYAQINGTDALNFNVANAVDATNAVNLQQLTSASGYITIDTWDGSAKRTMIIQWASATVNAANTLQTLALPIAFTTEMLSLTSSVNSLNSTGSATKNGSSLSSVGIFADNTDAVVSVLAIGY